MDLTENILAVILRGLSGFIGTIIHAILKFILEDLIGFMLNTFLVDFVSGTSFVNFDDLIDVFKRLGIAGDISALIYTISTFIIAVTIIITGVKMVAGFLDKTNDSPQAFFKRSLYVVLMLVGYKTIVNFVIQIMNAITSSTLVSLKGFKLDFGGSLVTTQTITISEELILIVLYVMFIKKIIGAAMTYIERYLSFAIYLLLGPIAISLGIDPENRDVPKNWLIGILSQMLVILFSMFVLNIFARQYSSNAMAMANPENTGGVGISLELLNFGICIILLTIVEKSESIINMLGIRTMPSGSTAREFAGAALGTLVTAWSFGTEGFRAADRHIGRGTGFKNDYKALRSQGKALGIPHSETLDRNSLAKKVAKERLDGYANKTGGYIPKKEKKAVVEALKQGGVSTREANRVVNEQAAKIERRAAKVNKAFSDVLGDSSGSKTISAKALEAKTGMSQDFVQFKGKDGKVNTVARPLLADDKAGNKTNVLGTVNNKDGTTSNIYGFLVPDSNGKARAVYYKGKMENGTFVGKGMHLEKDELKALNGKQMYVSAVGNERSVSDPHYAARFANDEKYKKIMDKKEDFIERKKLGQAGIGELNYLRTEMENNLKSKNLEDCKGYVEVGKFDSNKIHISDSNYSSAVSDPLGLQVKKNNNSKYQNEYGVSEPKLSTIDPCKKSSFLNEENNNKETYGYGEKQQMITFDTGAYLVDNEKNAISKDKNGDLVLDSKDKLTKELSFASAQTPYAYKSYLKDKIDEQDGAIGQIDYHNLYPFEMEDKRVTDPQTGEEKIVYEKDENGNDKPDKPVQIRRTNINQESVYLLNDEFTSLDKEFQEAMYLGKTHDLDGYFDVDGKYVECEHQHAINTPAWEKAHPEEQPPTHRSKSSKSKEEVVGQSEDNVSTSSVVVEDQLQGGSDEDYDVVEPENENDISDHDNETESENENSVSDVVDRDEAREKAQAAYLAEMEKQKEAEINKGYEDQAKVLSGQE